MLRLNARNSALKKRFQLKSALTINIFITLIGVSLATPILAYVMSNNQYYMQADSINFAGGASTSTLFYLEDTLGEVGTGYSTNTDYSLHAGFQQTGGERYLSLSAPIQVVMIPIIFGVSGGASSVVSTVHAITNNPDGYTLMVRASTSPALQSTSTGASFANYTPAVSSTPDFNWNVSAFDSEFGFTADGPDIVELYRDNGSACNQTVDSGTAKTCWNALTNLNTNVCRSHSANDSFGGSSTILEFRAESGIHNIQPPGMYQSVVTLTAFMN